MSSAISASSSASVPEDRPRPCFAASTRRRSLRAPLDRGPEDEELHVADVPHRRVDLRLEGGVLRLQVEQGNFHGGLRSGSVRASGAAVAILDAHDVVLAKIAPRLNLDDLQDLGAGVFDAMLGADRDVGRLIFAEVKDFVIARDPRGPVTTTQCSARWAVELQRDLRARVDREALHLKARAGIQTVIATPRAQHFAVQAPARCGAPSSCDRRGASRPGRGISARP